MSKKRDLTKGSIDKHMFRLSIPMMIGLIAILSFQFIDALFISMIGDEELTAISFTFPVTYLVFSGMMGLSIGVSSVISRLIGNKASEETHIITTQTLVLSVVISVIIGVIGCYTNETIFYFMGASADHIAMINEYMILWFIFLPFLIIPIVGNASLRAAGDASIPGMIMVTAALVNIILDPMFIFGFGFIPEMGIKGAAIATIIANILSTMLVMYYLFYKNKLFIIADIFKFKEYGRSSFKVFRIALPTSLSNIINPIAGILVTTLLAGYSYEAVAAYGIATRVEAIAFIPMMALAMAVGPIIGQNWGACINLRVRKSIRYAISLCLIWGIFSALILFLLSDVIASLFTNNEAIKEYTILYFMIVPIAYGLANATTIWGSCYNAIGMPSRAFYMNIVKMLFVYVPYAAYGLSVAGVMGAFIGISVGYALSGILYHFINRRNFPRV